jgi:hypothetical protein
MQHCVRPFNKMAALLLYMSEPAVHNTRKTPKCCCCVPFCLESEAEVRRMCHVFELMVCQQYEFGLPGQCGAALGRVTVDWVRDDECGCISRVVPAGVSESKHDVTVTLAPSDDTSGVLHLLGRLLMLG